MNEENVSVLAVLQNWGGHEYSGYIIGDWGDGFTGMRGDGNHEIVPERLIKATGGLGYESILHYQGDFCYR